MSYAIALWIRDTALRLKKDNEDLQKSIMTSLLNSNKGYEEKPIYFGGLGRPAENPYEIDIKGEKESLMWLLEE